MGIFEVIDGSSFFHVLISDESKKDIFLCDEDKIFLLNVIKKSQENEEYEIHGYCIMDNHVHLLLKIDKTLIKKVESTFIYNYRNYYNTKYYGSKRIENLKSKNESIKDTKEYVSVLRYILQNPQKAIIEKTEKYEWSSFNQYFSNKEDNLQREKFISNYVIKTIFKRRKYFCEYMVQKSFDEFLDLTLTREENDLKKQIILNYLLKNNEFTERNRIAVV